MTRVSSFAIAFAGFCHLVLAPLHYAHAPAHGIFFALAGVAEISWATVFLRKRTVAMYYAGLIMAGGLIVLWAITRLLPAPFHGSAEPVDLGGLVCKTSEWIGLVSLVILASEGKIAGIKKQSFVRLLSAALILSAVSGFFGYGLALASERLFPTLAASTHQENEPEHHHQEDEIHEHSE